VPFPCSSLPSSMAPLSRRSWYAFFIASIHFFRATSWSTIGRG
jgi:hypothetical protein